MPDKSLWEGALTFGLVNIPVALFTATSPKSISFNQIHQKCKTKIQEKRWCPQCKREVRWDEIEKGYQFAKDKFMAITNEDLASLPLPSKQTITVQAFVKLEEIDPVYFEKTYMLLPLDKAEKAFALFIHTLMDKNVVGIGNFAIRNKERLCCLRSAGGNLLLDTLLYPDEIKLDLKKHLATPKLSSQEIKMASSLVDMMMEKFDPQHFKDHYREALETLIEAKLKGVTLNKEQKAAKGAKLYDLMDALRKSVQTKSGKMIKPSRKSSSGKNGISKKSHLRSVAGGKGHSIRPKRKTS